MSNENQARKQSLSWARYNSKVTELANIIENGLGLN